MSDLDNEEIVLDIIPIYTNEMYPTKEGIFHYRYRYVDKKEKKEKESILNYMIDEIQHQFSDCNAVIILEKGKVIEIL